MLKAGANFVMGKSGITHSMVNDIAKEFALAMRHKPSKESTTATLLHNGEGTENKPSKESTTDVESFNFMGATGAAVTQHTGKKQSTRILLVDDNNIKRIVARKR